MINTVQILNLQDFNTLYFELSESSKEELNCLGLALNILNKNDFKIVPVYIEIINNTEGTQVIAPENYISFEEWLLLKNLQ